MVEVLLEKLALCGECLERIEEHLEKIEEYLMQEGELAAQEELARLTPSAECLPIAVKQWHGGSIGVMVHMVPPAIGTVTDPQGVGNSSNTSVGPTPISTPIFVTTTTVSPTNTTS